MDYATYIRVKAEMAAHQRLMQERQFPNEANGWSVQPNLLQRLGLSVSNLLRSAEKRESTKAAGQVGEQTLRPSSSR